MRALTPAAMQAVLAQQTAEVFIPCLRIQHPDLETIRVCYNTQTLTRADGDYLPYPFQLTLPNQREDEIPRVQVTIDNTDLTVNDAIRSLVGAPLVTLDVVLASSPDMIEAGPFYFELQQVTADASTIQGSLGQDESVFNQLFPGQQYTPVNSKGLFT